MIDLYKNKYDRKTLKENIYDVKLMDILITQTIDISFAVRYILNCKYQLTDDDKQIDTSTILKYQQHINKNDLYIALDNYESDEDSVEDFETFSNRK